MTTTASTRIDVAIVGAQKSGTSSLHRWLAMSSAVRSHDALEFPYFVEPSIYARGSDWAVEHYLRASQPDHRLTIIKSVGLMFIPGAIERLHAHNPDAHIIAVLREPAARARSAYDYLRSVGLETARDFREALAAEPNRLAQDFSRYHPMAYVSRGLYAEQLDRIHAIFGSERIRLILTEQLRNEGELTLAELHDWLGLPPPQHQRGLARHNEAADAYLPGLNRAVRSVSPLARTLTGRLPGGARRALRQVKRGVFALNRRRGTKGRRSEEEVVAELRERFAPHNARLSRTYGLDLAGWQ